MPSRKRNNTNADTEGYLEHYLDIDAELEAALDAELEQSKTFMVDHPLSVNVVAGTLQKGLPTYLQKLPPFLQKLRNMVDNPDLKNMICWDDTGSSIFIYPSDLVKVLPQYFKSNIHTFRRQLNNYCFIPMHWDKTYVCYMHSQFTRDYPQNMAYIQKKKKSSRSCGTEEHAWILDSGLSLDHTKLDTGLTLNHTEEMNENIAVNDTSGSCDNNINGHNTENDIRGKSNHTKNLNEDVHDATWALGTSDASPFTMLPEFDTFATNSLPSLTMSRSELESLPYAAHMQQNQLKLELRRERNKLHAKTSRERKKRRVAFLEQSVERLKQRVVRLEAIKKYYEESLETNVSKELCQKIMQGVPTVNAMQDCLI